MRYAKTCLIKVKRYAMSTMGYAKSCLIRAKPYVIRAIRYAKPYAMSARHHIISAMHKAKPHVVRAVNYVMNLMFRGISMAARKVSQNKQTGAAKPEPPVFSVDAMLKKMKQDALNNGKKDPEGVLARIEKGVQEAAIRLGSDASCINVINAGRMNHGKSSLLNSIMDSDVFKVNDVRETVINRRERYRDSIFLTDTPGLEAAAEDDSEAFNIYSSANFILFVHTLKIGELHSEEISYLKRLREMFPGDYLNTHLAIALTFIDSYKPDEIQAIKEKIKSSLQSELGMDNVRFFEVSNSRYKRWREEHNEKKKQVFLKGSGICEIRDFIAKHVPEWQSENRALKQKMLRSCQEKCAEIASSLRSPLNERIKTISDVSNQAKAAEKKRQDSISAIESEKSRLSSLRSRLESTRNKWNAEKF